VIVQVQNLQQIQKQVIHPHQKKLYYQKKLKSSKKNNNKELENKIEQLTKMVSKMKKSKSGSGKSSKIIQVLPPHPQPAPQSQPVPQQNHQMDQTKDMLMKKVMNF